MGDIDVGLLKETCSRIVREGDLDTLTDRIVRRSAEEKMGLERKTLDESPYKQLVKDTVAAVLQSISSEKEEEEEEEDEDKDDGCGDSEKESEDEKAASEGDATDNDFSDVVDEAPAGRRSKKRVASEGSPKATKRARTAAPGGKGAKGSSEVTITNLKSYIGKCGVRKVWSKELAGMSGAQQVQHLKKMLDELGMEGRPTLDKCKKIKAKRDLQAEMDEMDAGNILDTGDASATEVPARRRRGAAQHKISYNVDEISDSEEEEDEDQEAAADSADAAQDDGDDDDGSEAAGETSEESDAYAEDGSDSGPDSEPDADDST